MPSYNFFLKINDETAVCEKYEIFAIALMRQLVSIIIKFANKKKTVAYKNKHSITIRIFLTAIDN